MKRPRPSIGALSIFAVALLPHRHYLATASSSVVTEETSSGGGSGGDRSPDDRASSLPLHFPLPVKNTQKKAAPIAKLSTTGRSSDTGRSEEDAPEIPLIGLGVGNLPHSKIPFLLASALSSSSSSPQSSSSTKKKKKDSVEEELTNDYRLIDTSHTDSALEVLVGRSLSRLSSEGGNNNDGLILAGAGATTRDNDNVYHVMIKIWHTHLGYERTMLSVQDSLSDILPARLSAKGKKKKIMHHATIMGGSTTSTTTTPDVRIHAIIQYPRCYDTLFSSPAYLESHDFSQKFTNCQNEEDALDEATKMAGGASPLLDKENAWKRSYRALEELYHHGTLESIGISSNFEPDDLTQLFEMATVGPHVYQGTFETLIKDESTVEELVRHGVHYQVYDAASVVAEGKEGAPRAYARLEHIGASHGGMLDLYGADDNVYGYSPVQVVLGWLVHHKGVGVVPGTTNAAHLAENSPRSLGGMPRFSPREALDIETAAMALAEAKDIVEEEEGGSGGASTPRGTEEVVDADGYSYHVGKANNDDGRGGGFGGDDDHGGGTGIVATFFNTLPRNNVRIFHVHPESGEQIQISHSIPPGRSGRMIVNRNDVLIAYDGHGVAVKKFLVEELRGNGSVDFSVEA